MGCGAGLGGSHRGSAHQDRSLQLVRYAWRTWGPRHAGIHPGSWSRHQRRGGAVVKWPGALRRKGRLLREGHERSTCRGPEACERSLLKRLAD